MLSRRQLLASAASASVAATVTAAQPRAAEHSNLLLLSDPNPIATESALGYQRLLGHQQRPFEFAKELDFPRPRYLILPGARVVSGALGSQLYQYAAAGTWLIFESGLCFASSTDIRTQRQILQDFFSIRIDPPSNLGQRTYVHYHWPVHAMVPDFSEFVRVSKADADPIAKIHGEVVGIRKRIGRGGIVFLGSPLGPGLFAEDRESVHLARQIIGI